MAAYSFSACHFRGGSCLDGLIYRLYRDTRDLRSQRVDACVVFWVSVRFRPALWVPIWTWVWVCAGEAPEGAQATPLPVVCTAATGR